MNEQMMGMPQPSGSEVKDLLSSYRKAFGLVRKDAQKESKSSVWGSVDLEVPQGNVSPGWGSRVDLPEERPTFRDDRDSGDPSVNLQEYETFMSSHPFIQAYGSQMEQLVQELAEMVKDPENSMTMEEAQQLYVQHFGQMFQGWERGEAPQMEEEA